MHSFPTGYEQFFPLSERNSHLPLLITVTQATHNIFISNKWATNKFAYFQDLHIRFII